MKNNAHPIKDGIGVKLSGVVTVPQEHSPNCAASRQWKEILINSFLETRFKNVLTRATVLPRVDWFWHQESSLHLCDKAVALVAHHTNDYRQILIKHNQLASTLQDLDPYAEVLLLVSPWQNFVFGTSLDTGEMFSTHILFVQNCLGQNSRTVAQSNPDAVKPSSLSFAGIGGSI